jgi:predicted dehydrogenase
MTLGVAIIGCGLIGTKRARALAGQKLVVCADPDRARADKLAAATPGAEATHDWRSALRHPGVHAVAVATTNDALASVTLEAIRAGKHVLVEKPAARRAEELPPIIEAARANGVRVRVGFNHRYHPALLKAAALAREGALGPLMFLRARYGHGGRIGYDREWRADPAKSGGGELIDQGVHLIDLARCFLGEFEQVTGFAKTYYWDMPVDDNAFMLLRTGDQRAAFLHVSCTEWKNLFSLELYGKNGKLQIDGLGGSYGVERLTHYRMLPEMGPPETTSWEYPMGDRSWALEFEEFVEDIARRREPSAGLQDAYKALQVVEKIYQDSGYDHR